MCYYQHQHYYKSVAKAAIAKPINSVDSELDESKNSADFITDSGLTSPGSYTSINLKEKRIVMDDDPETLEWLDFDSYDVLQERFTALKDIFPNYSEIIYEYDFGDSWQHTITLEDIKKTDMFKATYLEGKGERPPEDVGGFWVIRNI